MTILSVAYPFAPVGFDAVGGAEQVLTQLDHALVAAGHQSIVVACEGSITQGSFIGTPLPPGQISPQARQETLNLHRKNIHRALETFAVDLVHLHGVDFYEYLPPAGVPVLATLHLPPHFYPGETFRLNRARTYLNCVSASQREACPRCDYLLPEIENGVPEEFFTTKSRCGHYALSLGRICYEKGYHLALEAAGRSGISFLLGGEVFAYPAHREYFDKEIAPRLDREKQFIGPVGFREKLGLLAEAQCLLVPSLVAETSSLVAMEAMASGTPVVAFPAGALRTLVEDGRMGFLVSNVEEMADAIKRCFELDRGAIRSRARQRFSVRHTIESYLALYGHLARRFPRDVYCNDNAALTVSLGNGASSL